MSQLCNPLCKKIIRYSVLTLLPVFAVVLCGLYYLLATTSGLRFTIDKLNSYLASYVKIDINPDSGSILRGFSCSKPIDVHVFGEVDVRAKAITIKYDLLKYLATDAVNVTVLEADTLEVELIDSPEGEEDSDYDDFRLDIPVHIIVDELKLKDFAYLSSTVDVLVKKASICAEVEHDYAGVRHGTIINPVVHLKYEGDDTPTAPLPEILTFDNGNGAIEIIHDIDLPLDVGLHQLNLEKARYYMDGYDTGIFSAKIDASWTHSLLSVKKIQIDHQLGSASLEGTMNFIDYYNMDFFLEGRGSASEYNFTHYDGALYGLEGSVKLTGNLTDMNVDADIKSPYQVKVKGRLNSLSDELPCYLSVDSQMLKYPLSDKVSIKEKSEKLSLGGFFEKLSQIEAGFDPSLDKSGMDDGDFTFNDTHLLLTGAVFKDMELTVKTALSGHGFSRLDMELNSTATLSKAHISSFRASGRLSDKSFEAEITGDFDYESDPDFKGRLTLKADDGDGFTSLLKGAINLTADIGVGYQIDGDEFTYAVPSLDADFYLNGKKASLEIRSFYGTDRGGFDLDTFRIVQDRSQLYLSGTVSQNSALDGKLELTDASTLIEGAKGEIIGRVSIRGSLANPLITLSARTDRLAYKNMLFSKIIIDSRADFSNGEFNFSAISNYFRLSRNVAPYRKCSLDLSGNVANHRLTVSCGSDSGSYITATGGLNQDTQLYEGVVSSMMVVSNVVDPIFLLEPVKFSYSFDRLSGHISPIALTDGVASLKINDIKLAPSRIESSVDLKNLNLATLKRYYDKDCLLTGRLSLSSKLAYDRGYPDIQADLAIDRGEIRYKSVLMPYKMGVLSVEVSGQKLTSAFDLVLDNDRGHIRLEADVSDPKGEKRINGTVRVENLSLDTFAQSSGSVSQVKGRADVKLDLKGTLIKPLLYGSISLKGSAVPSYNVGTVEDFDISVKAGGSTGVLKGMLKINGADALLTGDLDWTEQAVGRINFDADNLPLFLLSYGESLTNIHTTAVLDRNISVTGKVEIPSALIRFKQLEMQSVSPSKDEIFVDEGSTIRNTLNVIKEQGINNDMSIDVAVTLGDSVKVDAMGLKADAVGAVRIIKKSDEQTFRGLGNIHLEHGSADVYGHKFIVNKAQAVFVDSLFDPKLDAEVVADPSAIEDEVIAGVRVKGKASSPDISLFSYPAMSQNEILSYLLYGHGLEKNSFAGNNDNSGAQLLMTLGLGTTTGILNSVVGVFGMNGVQVGSSGSGDETQVELQTYLTNRVRLSYGYGVFNSINEFKLRYEIMRKLYVEYISSIDQSVDLIYSFDID
ncbi:MAG: translocation/assembly module TamB domain-containing protein [Succinivibrio sp.]